jgi:uncharacterized tellurite resistance protein B-like protein
MDARDPAKDALLDALEAFVARASASPAAVPPSSTEERQLRVATAVLFVQMARADRRVQIDEHRALPRALRRVLGLSDVEARAVLRLAEEEAARSVPFAALIETINRCCADDAKKKIIHGMWGIAFADAELQGHEEYLVRKLAEQLHLSTADLVETKVRAREEFLEEEP